MGESDIGELGEVVEMGPRIANLDFVASRRDDCQWSIRCYLRDGRILRVPTSAFPRLATASVVQLRDCRILFDGEGVHWAALDEDISVRGMLRFGSFEKGAPAKPLSLTRCPSCGEPWAEPVEFYRHVDHPKGKCTATAFGPPVRTLLAHVASEVSDCRDRLLRADREEGCHLSTALGIASTLVALGDLLAFLAPFAEERQPTDLVGQPSGLLHRHELAAVAAAEHYVSDAPGVSDASSKAPAPPPPPPPLSPRCVKLAALYEATLGCVGVGWVEGRFTVRVWDGMDGCWTDVLAGASAEEALTCWAKHTHNGTKQVRFDEIDYYRIFPADTQMHFDGSRGREIFRDDEEAEEADRGGKDEEGA